jgi:hypothetical protein
VEEAPEPEASSDEGMGIGAIIGICVAIVIAIGGAAAGGMYSVLECVIAGVRKTEEQRISLSARHQYR